MNLKFCLFLLLLLFVLFFFFWFIFIFLFKLLVVYIVVIPTGTLQLSNVQGGDGLVHSGGNTIVQYAQNQDGQQFFVPGELFRFCYSFFFVNWVFA